MNKEMKEATKQGKSQWIFSSQIMHKFSGCAGDGKLTVSIREPHRGS